jgi:hypothetical protein
VNERPLVDLGSLGFDQGAHLLVRLALDDVGVGGEVAVSGTHPDLARNLHAWCRAQGHLTPSGGSPLDAYIVRRGVRAAGRWREAQRAGATNPGEADALAVTAPVDWSFAPRGVHVEAGGEGVDFALRHRDTIWADSAPRLYAQALAGQWDPATAIDWSAPVTHTDRVEHAVVQVMAYLIENEEAALVVPARFLGQIHPHYREIQQVLAVTVADEARHIEVFTRRANLRSPLHALSTVGGRRSLATLLAEPDFAIASFLLSVLGEGTFVSLLTFLERCAPDPLTRRLAHLTRQDEARHVAFALAHLERHVALEPSLRARLASAVERRHDALATTSGLNEEVFDALVLLAAGEATPSAVAIGWDAVQQLQHDMDESRRARLARLGFTPTEAETLSSMHTRNFM